jgi:hypothetical protein
LTQQYSKSPVDNDHSAAFSDEDAVIKVNEHVTQAAANCAQFHDAIEMLVKKYKMSLRLEGNTSSIYLFFLSLSSF